MKKVCFCTPTMVRPYPEMVDAGLAEVPFLKEAGFEDIWAWEIGHAYVSYARALLLRKALNWLGDDDGWIVFVDHDMSWKPGELTRLVQTKGDIVAGTYRLKSSTEEYMGRRDEVTATREPVYGPDGLLSMILVPSGFIKMSKAAVLMAVEHYPQFTFSRPGEVGRNHFDLWNHGVIDHTWFGEDFAFSLRWVTMKQKLWCLPDLELTHWSVTHDGERIPYKGNFAKYLKLNPLALCRTNENGVPEPDKEVKDSEDRGTSDVKPKLEPHVTKAKENVYADETERYIPRAI